MDWRGVVRLVDQYRQLMVGKWHIFHCWWCFVLATISSIRVGWLRWWREMDDGRLLSRVDYWSPILDLRSVEVLRGTIGVTL